MRRFAILLSAAFVAASATTLGATSAQSSVDFTAAVQNNYPAGVEFDLQASADEEIVDVSLHYSVVGRGTTALGKPDELTPGNSVQVSIEVLTNASGYIPVGSEFIYFWEVSLAGGDTATSEEVSLLYLPPNQDWQSASNDIATVYYHGDRARTADLYLEAATDTYETIGQGLLQTTLTQIPVKVILFSDEAEMDQAQFGRSETYDSQTITCGTKVAKDIVFVIPVSCGGDDITETLRHEFTHILNEAAGESALGQLPAWVDEGTAMYGQTEPGDNYTEPFLVAAQVDRLFPFATMGTPSGDPQTVNLFYGQSWAMVAYLVTQYGEEAYAEFFATIKAGNRADSALQQVYGFDMDGFEDEFRAFYGVTSEPTAVPTQPPRNDAAQPTALPTEPPAVVARPSTGGDGFDRIYLVVIGATVMFLLVAVFFYLISMMMASNRTDGGGAA